MSGEQFIAVTLIVTVVVLYFVLHVFLDSLTKYIVKKHSKEEMEE